MSTSLQRIRSIPEHDQAFSNCYAHSTVRSFTRTLQVLKIISDKFIFHFYKVFVIILTIQFSNQSNDLEPIPGLLVLEPSSYLLDILKTKPEELFKIRDDGHGLKFFEEDKCITNTKGNKGPFILGDTPIKGTEYIFSEEDKHVFLTSLKKVIDHIIIISERYIFTDYSTKSIAIPSLLMIDSLQKGLQPDVYFTLPILPWLEHLKSTNIYDCEEDGAHGITIQSWTKTRMTFRNSWGKDSNFSIESENLAYLSCRNQGDVLPITIIYITFTDEVYDIYPELKGELNTLHQDFPLTDFQRTDVENKFYGVVNLGYNFNDEKARNFLIENQLVDLLHMARFFLVDYDESILTNEHPKFKNHLLFFDLLTKYGSSIVNNQDENGNTALHHILNYSYNYDSQKIALEALLQFGADPSIQNNEDKTAIQILYSSYEYILTRPSQHQQRLLYEPLYNELKQLLEHQQKLLKYQRKILENKQKLLEQQHAVPVILRSESNPEIGVSRRSRKRKVTYNKRKKTHIRKISARRSKSRNRKYRKYLSV